MNGNFPLQLKQALRTLGFSENEAKVINFMLHQKKAHVREISQHTAIGFATLHHTLTNLVSKSIVRVSSGDPDMYEMVSEKEFLQWIEDQKKENQHVYDRASDDIRGCIERVHESSWKPDILYFEGVEGIKEIYRDVIATGEDVYSFLDIQKIHAALDPEFLNEYIAQRKEKNMTSHSIMPRTTENQDRPHDAELRKVKYVDSLPIDGEIRIYDSKVAIITFHQDNPVGVVLKGETNTRLFRALFETMWKSLP